MTDLSKIPDLELRQKAKVLNDAIDAIDNKIAAVQEEFRAKMNAACAALDKEREALDDELASILGEDREIVGTCCKTGLPIFDGDETRTFECLEAVA